MQTFVAAPVKIKVSALNAPKRKMRSVPINALYLRFDLYIKDPKTLWQKEIRQE